MSAVIQPPVAAVDLHSPGPIGDVTPGTIAATSLAVSNGLTNNGGNLYIHPGGDVYLNKDEVFGWTGSTTAIAARDAVCVRTGTNAMAAQDGAGNAAIWKAKLTTDTAATTGLVAGVFAATTTATLRIYDSAGAAYRIAALPE